MEQAQTENGLGLLIESIEGRFRTRVEQLDCLLIVAVDQSLLTCLPRRLEAIRLGGTARLCSSCSGSFLLHALRRGVV